MQEDRKEHPEGSGLSAQDQEILIQISHAVKDEHFATIETQSILELKVERMKRTVLLLRDEILAVSKSLDEEILRI